MKELELNKLKQINIPDTVVYGQGCKHRMLLEKKKIKLQKCIIQKYVYITDHVWTLALREHLYQKIATP